MDSLGDYIAKDVITVAIVSEGNKTLEDLGIESLEPGQYIVKCAEAKRVKRADSPDCSTCTERQGQYLDAETIRNQQERIAELEREGAAAFYDASYTRDALRQRDELIREILKALSAECKPYRINGLPEQVAYFKAKARNMGCEVDE